ncbi:MAG: hypothetical protein FWD64_04000 [Acidobacteriaceae bacterium]|nr:hypothetical protein [Acidobacteriaceae bacterium]
MKMTAAIIRNLLLLGSVSVLAAGCGGGSSNNSGNNNNGGKTSPITIQPMFGTISSQYNIALTATTTSGNATQIVWSATEGTFSPPTGATTTYVPDPAITTYNNKVTVTASLNGKSASIPIMVNFAPSSTFSTSGGMAIDSNGNLYLSDQCSIRKVDLPGNVTTIAGSGGSCTDADGNGTQAGFLNTAGIAIDNNGNLYVTESSGTIRKLTPSGSTWTVSTIAGKSNVNGYTDGDGAQAQFNAPRGIAIDKSGNLYVADAGNSVIRKLTPSGSSWTVSTIAGSSGVQGSADGPGNQATFKFTANSSGGYMTIDNSGNLYITDDGGTIRKLTQSGSAWTVSTLAGAVFDGLSFGITADSKGNLYVGDLVGIHKATLSGSTWKVNDITLPNMPASEMWNHTPTGLVMDGNGNLFAFENVSLSTGRTSWVIAITPPNNMMALIAGSAYGYYYYGSQDGTAEPRQ